MNKLRRLFSNYVHGKSTGEEEKIIDLWYEEKAKSPVDLATDDDAEQFSQRIWDEFLIYGEKATKKRRWSPWIMYGMIGAAVVVLLVLINFPMKDFNLYEQINRQSITVGATKQFVAGNKMKRITLADGSIIEMNRGTVIVLQEERFNAHVREVWLEEGEAFFEVAKDPSRPFIVHTEDGLSTMVLGTSFNIKSYHQLKQQVISVRTGRVQVSNERGEKVLLDVNRKATFHPATQQLTAGTTDGAGAADWRSGRIVLEHVKMDELAFRLKQYYDVEVVNNAISEDMEIYTSFHISTPLEHVVNTVANIFGMSYKIENGTVYFY